MRTLCWISRVSSYSNIADGLPRGDMTLMKLLDFGDVSLDACNCLKELCMSVKSKMGKKADMYNPNSQQKR